MKHSFLTIAVLSSMLLYSCKKDKTAVSSPDTISTRDFSYNIATRQISPDAEINGELNSPAGIKLIYYYLVRNNIPDSLVHIGTPAEGSRNSYKFSIPTGNFGNAKMNQVTGIKMMVKHLDNTSFEGFIKVTAFTPPLPKIEDTPVSLIPDANGKIHISGKASSENGLKLIEIYDDFEGTFALAGKIDLSQNEKVYQLNYEYSYRKNAGKLKIVATDHFGLKAEALISIPLKSYALYQDLTMMANGTASAPSGSSFFIGETGSVLGSCNISGQEQKIDFVTYCSSTTAVFTLYSPGNTTTIAKNYKCGAIIWEPNATDLKASRFRVLIPGIAAADRIYTAYNGNTITDLNDQFFEGIALPGSSTAKFDAAVANQAANTFNLTAAYLLWIRVPKADGSFVNQLLRAKEVIIGSTPALSTIKFDILVSR
ncbi:hypothetical protein BFS30_00350 [Pedobacter steynii]|uniref:Uncharacterized protein n=2 Tax=Pedobacter steynii TaxID=430522 RepID=A0A1D7QAT4_9SPHI|nr:hypothetical protein BFS30_00350 [Pedobacter steynii]